MIIPADRVRYSRRSPTPSRRITGGRAPRRVIAASIWQLDGRTHGVWREDTKTCATCFISARRKLRRISRPKCAKAPARFPRTGAASTWKTEYVYTVRGRGKCTSCCTARASRAHASRASPVPKYENPGDILRWLLKENLPGRFPFTVGRLPIQARGERSHAHVRRGKAIRPHEPPVQISFAQSRGQTAVGRRSIR